jgi:putative lipoic acid-binding regulatory protein
MDPAWLTSFREKLDAVHSWPMMYIFKFIIPKGKEDDVRKLFPLHIATERESKNGNYTSLTIQMMMPSGEAVVEVYQKASAIEGIIAL